MFEKWTTNVIKYYKSIRRVSYKRQWLGSPLGFWRVFSFFCVVFRIVCLMSNLACVSRLSNLDCPSVFANVNCYLERERFNVLKNSKILSKRQDMAGVNLGAREGWTIPAPLATPVVLLLLWIRWWGGNDGVTVTATNEAYPWSCDTDIP